MDDHALLRSYWQDGSEDAFSELVSRHFTLVYSAASRQLNGNVQLAEDAAQTVFTDLASKARTIPSTVMLRGWLYRHTCFVARKMIRSAQRRQGREVLATELGELSSPNEFGWQELAPYLDEAICRLGEADRTAIVLRYLEGWELRRVGLAIGVSEEAAKKRVSRALEKLRRIFNRRGLEFTVSGLAALLTANAIQAVPAGVAGAVATSAITNAAGSTSGYFWLTKFLGAEPLRTGALASLAVGIVFLSQVILHRQHADAREVNALASTQVAKPAQPQEEKPERLGIQSSGDDLARWQKEHGELLRLRGEVALLRNMLRDATNHLEESIQTMAMESIRFSEADRTLLLNSDVDKTTIKIGNDNSLSVQVIGRFLLLEKYHHYFDINPSQYKRIEAKCIRLSKETALNGRVTGLKMTLQFETRVDLMEAANYLSGKQAPENASNENAAL